MRSKYIAILISSTLILGPSSLAIGAAPQRFITASDLLRAKGLSPYNPPCAIGSSSASLKTAEDLLREKGLLKVSPSSKSSEEEEDIWGMDQDFGC